MDECAVYKLNRDQYIFNLVSFLLLGACGIALLICSIILLIETFFLNGKSEAFLSFFFLGISLFFLFAVYFSSKKIVVKIKWYNDHFALCTLYGETSFSFDKKELYDATHNLYGRTTLHFKKERQTFRINDEGFPEVVKKLNQIYGTVEEEIPEQEKDEEDYVMYKTLSRYGNKKTAIGLCGLGAVIILYFTLFTNWNFYTLFGLFWGGYSLVAAYKILNAVVEIRWYKDKFVLRSLSRKEEFSFDRKILQKIKKNQNGFIKFVFGKQEWDSFAVDERDFPEVVEKLKKIFGEKLN